MKRKIKKVFISICLSVICGSICGKIVYGIYEEKLESEINGEKVYLIQAGAYSSYNNMVENTTLNNYVYYEDDGLFKSIIGITGEYDNIKKITDIYDKDVVVTEYYSNDLELNKKIREYDKKLNNSNNQEEVKENILEMLSLYKDNNSTLVEIVS